MPPVNSLANSPTRLEPDLLLPITPPLSPSTRLPILRTAEDGEESWRRLLARAIDQVSDPGVEPPSTTAHDDTAHRMASEGASTFSHPPAMSTYRGWAPGTIEHERPQPNRVRRNDHTSSSTATRRFRREQEMSHPVNPYNVAYANAQVERDEMDWEASHSIPRRREPGTSAGTSLRAHAMMEAVRRQRVETLRERIHNFASARGHSDQAQQLNALEEYAHLTYNEAQDTVATGSRQDSAKDEEYIVKLLEEVITLLDGLRKCFTKDERMTFLGDAGFQEIANHQRLDIQTVLKPQPSSYLQPGAVFAGQQETAQVPGEQMRQRGWSRRRQIEQGTYDAIGHTRSISRDWTGAIVPAATVDRSEDCWPVKVTITGVDLQHMTMTGTMEAFNVPNCKGIPIGDSKVSSITTYLEGEIIDLQKHTLKTKNFEAGLDIDAMYWRKLEPFRSLDTRDIVTGLLDSDWLSRNVTNQWIMMRWKERCFVPQFAPDSGLTIAGFYYITLRRSDGKIEGLYHDPRACPYQYLNLMAERPSFPIYAFR